MSRSILRSALELRSPVTRLPPTFLLPIRARWISSSSPSSSPHAGADTLTTASAQPALPPSSPPPSSASLKSSRAQQTSSGNSRQDDGSLLLRTITIITTPSPLLENSTDRARTPARCRRAHPRLGPPAPPPSCARSRPTTSQYTSTAALTSSPQATPVRLPFLMPGVAPGDVLRLNRASVLGSRDFTLRPTDPTARKPGSNEVAYIDERLFECRATVVGVDSEPMRIKEKTKRRNRRVRTVKSKHRYTVLRISELRIKSPAEVDG
ncbi:hypothetical protein OPQ81_001997 [Rhizoctonia solani]|nr:hypothetical protein OPQ81_001997 [Rhizoctonia solani]